LILRAVLGISDATLRERMGGIFEAMLHPATMLGLSLAIGGGRPLSAFGRRYYRLKRGLDELVRAHIVSTRADRELAERDDILAMLVQARDADGDGLTDDEVRDELVTLIAAGYETTATAIAWGVDLLVHNPQVLQRAKSAALNGDEDGYLDAVIKEILRIRPPVPVSAARHPAAPLAIGPWTIEPTAIIAVDAHAVHHDPAVYPDPAAFRPERFIESPPDGFAFIPFGGGAHRCLGAALAQLEMKIVLGAILSRLELTATDSSPERSRRRSTTLSPRHGTRVRVVRSASAAASENVRFAQ
jgi:cytochrome P450